MPTVWYEPDDYKIRYHYSVLERFDLQEKLNTLEKFLMFQIITSRARRRREGDGYPARRRRFLGIFLTFRCIQQTRAELFRTRKTILHPSFEFYPGGASDPWWEENEQLFFNRFRFRRVHFLTLMDEMELTGKSIKCRSGPAKSGQHAHVHNYPAEICIMVVLRRLAYPCTFENLVNIFGYPKNRICDIYHAGIDYIYFKYKKLVNLETWVPFFGKFADLYSEYGSPYASNVAMIDGTFTAICRPGGLRNVRATNRIDQRMYYNGDKGTHGYQTMGAFFPNGMIAMSDPFYGKTHDSRLMNETGWIRIIREAARADGRSYTVFGDAAFGSSDIVQCMVKGVYHPDDRSFNALMSRIRVSIENAFAGQSNQFQFLSFFRKNVMGGRHCPRQFIVAAIFMNIRATFYGNQFTHELNNVLRFSVQELLALAE
jgi:hypothetical protein